MSNVIACIDGSAAAPAVCDYASWASQRLAAPLTLLHVLDHERYPVDSDLSGAIGLGAREQLLEELAALDEKRARLAMEQGRQMLEVASQRVVAQGASNPTLRQRHGSLASTLRDMAHEVRLLVMGLHGEASGDPAHPIGSQLESVVRTLQQPILIVPSHFQPPASALLAFDGSSTTRRSVERVVASPLLKEIPIHIVMVGKPTDEATQQLDWAVETLRGAGFSAERAHLDGEVEPAIHAYQSDHDLDLLIMGAYGHSRIREFLLGSTTTRLMRTTRSPLLVLR